MSQTEKLPCQSCGALILPQTWSRNNGFCMPCKSGTRAAIERSRAEKALIKETPPESEFICLECGSKRYRCEYHVNTIKDAKNPWSLATSRVECWDCGAVMPRQLARRWNLTYEQAKEVWTERYRHSPQSKVKNT